MPSSAGIVLSTYGSRASEGKNLGSAGYSYDFVVKQFVPLLKECGEVIEVPAEAGPVEQAAERLRRRGFVPLHLCFMPFQHAYLSPSVPNVVVPAWEFPEVPDHEFDGDPRNNWVEQANRCAGVIVGGPWTAWVFRTAGIKCPIHIVPVPTPESNFKIPHWYGTNRITIDCAAIDCRQPDSQRQTSLPRESDGGAFPQGNGKLSTARRSVRSRFAAFARAAYKQAVRPLLPTRVGESLSAGIAEAIRAWRPAVSYPRLDRLQLSGVVYTSIFNPQDGRKNWEDLITAYLLALGDCPDATLVLKLVARNRHAADAVLAHCARLDLAHRCRLLVVTDFLSREQMQELARGTTYYITSTRAEGNCLPLMDYLAAGRPAVSPRHTAISDYFGTHAGFEVESHPEPTAFPQDRSLRCRTYWQRLVWTSLADQIRHSYEVATEERDIYERLAAQARETMAQWSHPKRVVVCLREAIDAVISENAENSSSRVNVPHAPRLKAAA